MGRKVTITCFGNIGHISKISQKAERRNKQNQVMKDFVKGKKRRSKK